MSGPFTTANTFSSAADAVAFFNENRADGIDPIPPTILAFLDSIKEYDPGVLFNAQPAFRTHFVSTALPDDHHPWLFAKPNGVVFQLGDARNVEAVLDMWGSSKGNPPALMMETDIWFSPDDLHPDSPMAPAVELCLRLSAAWGQSRRRG